MPSLHLKKSRLILDKRTYYLRLSLTGQQLITPHVEVLSKEPLKSQVVFSGAQSLKNDQKFVKNHTNLQNDTFKTQKTTKSKKGSWRNAVFTGLMSLSFALLVTLFGPVIYFRYFNHEVVPVQTTETGTPLGGTFEPPKVEERTIAQPPRDENLPEGNWVIIPKIGVRTEILESQTADESLVKGVWRVPDFGKPGEIKEPMILAAHRYGYNWWWKGTYWKYHSFYLLPDLKPGDLVEVISDKRKYLYEIYAGEEGTEITDYNADLILYTCKFLTSDIRHFRYARLIDPSKYSNYTTQVSSPSAAVN